MNKASLLIMGGGDLGWRVAKLALSEFSVDIVTQTHRRHAQYVSWPVGLFTWRDFVDSNPSKYSHVLVCVPPTSSEVSEATEFALSHWKGPAAGQAVFISSTGIYSENGGVFVDESSDLNVTHPLYSLEQLAKKHHAHILRLAGLYSSESGPHVYWQRAFAHNKKSIEANSNGLINLIHRQDAAEVVLRLLGANISPKTWNLSDAHPMSRKNIAKNFAEFSGLPSVLFSSEEKEDGRRVKQSLLLEKLDYTLRWKDFSDFLDSLKNQRNVFGQSLKSCCQYPVTGFYRDGKCQTGFEDKGEHTACAEMTDEFLAFSKSRGNDLSTPRPEFGFAGLRAGDRWCLCAPRWREAHLLGKAPKIYLESCHESFLEWAPLKELKAYALDLA